MCVCVCVCVYIYMYIYTYIHNGNFNNTYILSGIRREYIYEEFLERSGIIRGTRTRLSGVNMKQPPPHDAMRFFVKPAIRPRQYLGTTPAISWHYPGNILALPRQYLRTTPETYIPLKGTECPRRRLGQSLPLRQYQGRWGANAPQLYKKNT